MGLGSFILISHFIPLTDSSITELVLSPNFSLSLSSISTDRPISRLPNFTSTYSKMSSAAVSYAALILADAEIEISSDKLLALTKAAGVEVDSVSLYLYMLFHTYTISHVVAIRHLE